MRKIRIGSRLSKALGRGEGLWCEGMLVYSVSTQGRLLFNFSFKWFIKIYIYILCTFLHLYCPILKKASNICMHKYNFKFFFLSFFFFFKKASSTFVTLTGFIYFSQVTKIVINITNNSYFFCKKKKKENQNPSLSLDSTSHSPIHHVFIIYYVLNTVKI